MILSFLGSLVAVILVITCGIAGGAMGMRYILRCLERWAIWRLMDRLFMKPRKRTKYRRVDVGWWK